MSVDLFLLLSYFLSSIQALESMIQKFQIDVEEPVTSQSCLHQLEVARVDRSWPELARET